jgi:hypothetical protein
MRVRDLSLLMSIVRWRRTRFTCVDASQYCIRVGEKTRNSSSELEIVPLRPVRKKQRIKH